MGLDSWEQLMGLTVSKRIWKFFAYLKRIFRLETNEESHLMLIQIYLKIPLKQCVLW